MNHYTKILLLIVVIVFYSCGTRDRELEQVQAKTDSLITDMHQLQDFVKEWNHHTDLVVAKFDAKDYQGAVDECTWCINSRAEEIKKSNMYAYRALSYFNLGADTKIKGCVDVNMFFQIVNRTREDFDKNMYAVMVKYKETFCDEQPVSTVSNDSPSVSYQTDYNNNIMVDSAGN